MSLSTDTVIAREVEWLSTTSDSLPVLLKVDVTSPDAPFDFIKAYWPSNTDANRGVYVLRGPRQIIMEGPGRVIPRHTMICRVWWSILAAKEVEQAALDVALDALVDRIVGPLQDKTHGGRFLSCAEPLIWGQPGVTITTSDPERADGQLRADVTYTIDDFEQNR